MGIYFLSGFPWWVYISSVGFHGGYIFRQWVSMVGIYFLSGFSFWVYIFSVGFHGGYIFPH